MYKKKDMKRYEFRGTTLGELYHYDSEGYEITDTSEIDDMLYTFGEDDLAFAEPPVTLLYISGQSKMAWYTTDPNPDGYTEMIELF
tara:strand:+ start:2747 stop:3004 length:258 start_codon:yes stop_codon:yes gene_type:complete